MLSNKEHNLIIYILDELEEHGYITKDERKSERLMFESYKKDNDLQGFWNNEGDSRKYDCCYRFILELFGVIIKEDLKW